MRMCAGCCAATRNGSDSKRMLSNTATTAPITLAAFGVERVMRVLGATQSVIGLPSKNARWRIICQMSLPDLLHGLPHEIHHHRTFQSERQIAGIAEQRHLEQVEPLHVRDAVVPLREAAPVPQFPEHT